MENNPKNTSTKIKGTFSMKRILRHNSFDSSNVLPSKDFMIQYVREYHQKVKKELSRIKYINVYTIKLQKELANLYKNAINNDKKDDIKDMLDKDNISNSIINDNNSNKSLANNDNNAFSFNKNNVNGSINTQICTINMPNQNHCNNNTDLSSNGDIKDNSNSSIIKNENNLNEFFYNDFEKNNDDKKVIQNNEVFRHIISNDLRFFLQLCTKDIRSQFPNTNIRYNRRRELLDLIINSLHTGDKLKNNLAKVFKCLKQYPLIKEFKWTSKKVETSFQNNSSLIMEYLMKCPNLKTLYIKSLETELSSYNKQQPKLLIVNFSDLKNTLQYLSWSCSITPIELIYSLKPIGELINLKELKLCVHIIGIKSANSGYFNQVNGTNPQTYTENFLLGCDYSKLINLKKFHLCIINYLNNDIIQSIKGLVQQIPNLNDFRFETSLIKNLYDRLHYLSQPSYQTQLENNNDIFHYHEYFMYLDFIQNLHDFPKQLLTKFSIIYQIEYIKHKKPLISIPWENLKSLEQLNLIVYISQCAFEPILKGLINNLNQLQYLKCLVIALNFDSCTRISSKSEAEATLRFFSMFKCLPYLEYLAVEFIGPEITDKHCEEFGMAFQELSRLKYLKLVLGPLETREVGLTILLKALMGLNQLYGLSIECKETAFRDMQLIKAILNTWKESSEMSLSKSLKILGLKFPKTYIAKEGLLGIGCIVKKFDQLSHLLLNFKGPTLTYKQRHDFLNQLKGLKYLNYINWDDDITKLAYDEILRLTRKQNYKQIWSNYSIGIVTSINRLEDQYDEYLKQFLSSNEVKKSVGF